MANGVHEYQDFYASCDHMPGSDRALKVTGTVVFRTSGFDARLQRLNEPGGINDTVLNLVLRVEPPAPGEPVQEVLTPVRVEFRESDPPIEYTEVHFRLEGIAGEAPPSIEVEHPR